MRYDFVFIVENQADFSDICYHDGDHPWRETVTGLSKVLVIFYFLIWLKEGIHYVKIHGTVYL